MYYNVSIVRVLNNLIIIKSSFIMKLEFLKNAYYDFTRTNKSSILTIGNRENNQDRKHRNREMRYLFLFGRD